MALATRLRSATQIAWSEFTTTTTGNIDDLDFSNADLIRLNNATLSTIRGLKAGTAGQRVTIFSVGAGQVDLAHQDAGSTAANRLINFATVGKTPLAAGVGTATYEYDGTTARWRLISHVQGAFITPTFAAGDYTGGGAQTWTVDAGDVSSFGYLLEGKILNLTFNLVNTSVGGTPNADLNRVLPNSFTVAKTTGSLYAFDDNATTGAGEILFSTAAPTLMVFRRAILSGSVNWTNPSTNGTNLRGAGKVEIT